MPEFFKHTRFGLLFSRGCFSGCYEFGTGTQPASKSGVYPSAVPSHASHFLLVMGWNPQDLAGSPVRVLRVRAGGPKDQQALGGVSPSPRKSLGHHCVSSDTPSLSAPRAKAGSPKILGTFFSLPKGAGLESAQVFPWELGAREGVRGCDSQGHPPHTRTQAHFPPASRKLASGISCVQGHRRSVCEVGRGREEGVQG